MLRLPSLGAMFLRLGSTAMIRRAAGALTNYWVCFFILIVGVLAGYYLELADAISLLWWEQPPPPPTQ
jgi:hypothetical protein